MLKLEKDKENLNLIAKLGLHHTNHKSMLGHFSLFKEDILKINGYDEKYKGWGAEDCDLDTRLVQSGL